MTLEEQFEQWKEDVKNYINPEKMWEGGVTSYNSYGDIEFSGIVQMPEGIEFNEFVKGMDEVWRKQSAALPFDLAAALAGDAVEILTCNEWLDCSNDYALYLYNNEGHDNKNSKTHLRMKHPRRVGVDYSRFEEK